MTLRFTEHEVAAYLARHRIEGPRMPQDALSPPRATTEPESVLLARIRRLATALGYCVYHTHRSDRSEPGFPDLVLVRPRSAPRPGHALRPGRLIFAELKSATGKLTADQAMWLDLLRHTGLCEVYCWRNSDWPEIERVLGGA